MYKIEEIKEIDGTLEAVYIKINDTKPTHSTRPLDEARIYLYLDNDNNVVGVKVFKSL